MVAVTGGGIGGSGTTNYISKWTASGVLGNSLIFDNGTIVGIGTSSPSLAAGIGLSIYNSSGQTRIALKNNTTGDGANDGFQIAISGDEAILDQRENSPLRFTTNAIERMRISSTGNVGIGTSSPMPWGGGFLGLSVGQASVGCLPTTANSYFTNNIYYDGAFRRGVAAASSIISMNEDVITFGNSAAGTAGGTITFNERMRITSAGNVGIGTTNPLFKLDVIGGIRVNEDGAGTKVIQIRSDFAGVDPAINVSTNNALLLQTNNTERMRITSGGNVLIGSSTINTTLTSNPGLQVSREIVSLGTNAGLFTINRASSNFFGWYGNTQFYAWNTDVGNIASINYSSGAYTAISDINKKKDIEDSVIGLNEILGLNPVLFRMKTDNDNSKKQLGFIAQQVKEFIPQAYVEDGEGDNVFIGLTDRPIIAALVKAIQEQQEIINQLLAKVTDLKAENDEVKIVVSYPDPAISQDLIDQVNAQAMAAGQPAPQVPMLHDVQIKRIVKDGRVRIMAVPPEELVIDRRARSFEDAALIAHRQMLTVADLISISISSKDGDESKTH